MKPSPSAKGVIRDARRITAEADAKNDSVRKELTTAEERLTNYRDRDYRALQSLVTRLLARLKTIKDELEAERKLRTEVSNKLVEAQAQVAVKDKENDTLRSQFADMQATADSFEQSAKANHDAAQKKAGEVEYHKGKNALLTKLLIGVAIALLISLAIHYFTFKRSMLPF